MTDETRAGIVVRGDVQEGGYRSRILSEARARGITGYVENLPDGSVTVVCEGPRDVVESFVESLRIENDFVSVEDIEVEYLKASGEYEAFEVKIEDIGYELFQGFNTARRYLLHSEERISGRIGSMSGEMKKSFSDLDAKYGQISGTLAEIRGDFRELVDLLREFLERS